MLSETLYLMKKKYFLLVSNDERAYLSEIKVERGYMDNLN